jgi:glutamate-ammonia-ligase adenylyltransferase
MALCRARPLYGSPAAREKLAGIIRTVLERPRDPEKLKADVLKMRGDMAAHKSPRGLLDVKLMRGGLVDCEFLVHYLQLRERIAFHPPMEQAITGLADAGLLPGEFVQNFLRIARVLTAARLLAPDGQEPPPAARVALAAACGEKDFDALIATITRNRQAVAVQWLRHFGETLEI